MQTVNPSPNSPPADLPPQTQSGVVISQAGSDSGRGLSPALEAANRKRAELKAAGLTPQRRMPAASVLMKAIRENCLECEGGEDPCVQWRIANCLVPGCTLRRFRPFQHLEGMPLPRGLQYGFDGGDA